MSDESPEHPTPDASEHAAAATRPPRRGPWIVAAAVAVTLVAGVSAVVLASGSSVPETAVSTPAGVATPTADASPSPSPTAEPPAEGTQPFSGSCAEVLTVSEVEAVTGLAMVRTDFPWEPGWHPVLGGIDCVWVSESVYMGAITRVYAYPEAVVPVSVMEANPAGCSTGEPEHRPETECVAVGVVDGTWLFVSAYGADVEADAVEGLFALAAEKMGEYPSGVAMTPQDDWWELPDCTVLAAAIDPAVHGYERVEASDETASAEAPVHPAQIPGTSTRLCTLSFSSGEGEGRTGTSVAVTVIPGGGVSFWTAEAVDSAPSVSVAGAEGSAWVPGLARFEGSWGRLAVTDGVNTLMLEPSPSPSPDPDALAPLAEAILLLL
ncbi:hypothetical protein [Microbacterium thalassium]|uniref:DUF3558 domain-containing protein n=1 Tax=Microbacterium thalassium TaxID=362649 RepID=A0A7X0FQ15_9MICO|nr:hypothetical protein [Microbacterium thalassium]MBB6391454.1 hypothetical protein [Microbacterium thalassium]GLK24153.1 hypothetical protein GCM10017607_14710 [Microbacterium thalassium]